MNWLLTDGPSWAAFIATLLPLGIYSMWTAIDRSHILEASKKACADTELARNDADAALHWCQQVHDALQRPQTRPERQTAAGPLTNTNPILPGTQRANAGVERTNTIPGPHGATAIGRHRRPR